MIDYTQEFRATVVDNNDPQKKFRLCLKSEILSEGAQLNWVRPEKMPLVSDGGFFLPPSVGDLVSLRFDKGDMKYPFWSYSQVNSDNFPTWIQEDYLNCAILRWGEVEFRLNKITGKIRIKNSAINFHTLINAGFDRQKTQKVPTMFGGMTVLPDNILQIEQEQQEFNTLFEE